LAEDPAASEIEITPHRLLGKNTTRKLLKFLGSIPSVTNMLLDSIDYKDGTGSLTKRIIVQVKDTSQIDTVLIDIEGLCRNLLPAGHDVRVGRFTKTRPTVSDYLRQRFEE